MCYQCAQCWKWGSNRRWRDHPLFQCSRQAADTWPQCAREVCLCSRRGRREKREWGSRDVPRVRIGVCGVLTMTHCLQSSQSCTLEFEISFRKKFFLKWIAAWSKFEHTISFSENEWLAIWILSGDEQLAIWILSGDEQLATGSLAGEGRLTAGYYWIRYLDQSRNLLTKELAPNESVLHPLPPSRARHCFSSS